MKWREQEGKVDAELDELKGNIDDEAELKSNIFPAVHFNK